MLFVGGNSSYITILDDNGNFDQPLPGAGSTVNRQTVLKLEAILPRSRTATGGPLTSGEPGINIMLHEKHGPIVRYGVRSISVSDPSVIDVVYGSRAGFTTADSYKVLVGISNGKEVASLVSTADETRHGQLRRSIAGAFTAQGVLDYEPYVHETIQELLDHLARRTVVDLSAIILYYTMDAAGRFSFGAPLGCLEADDDVGGSIQVIRDRFNHWGWWSSLPGLERLVYRNPYALRMKRAPSGMAASAISKLKARMAKPQHPSQPQDLLSKFLEASKVHPDVLDTPGIVGMLMSTISGAGDTTATAVTAIMFQLLKNPEAFAKLESELSSAKLDTPIPAYSQTRNLPYLNAVIREGMRLFPSATWPIERRIPAGGATIAGTFFPEGTSIGAFPAALHLNTEVFGKDALTYRPDRWLTSNVEQLRAMEAAHMGFSRGRRVCLGQHIAVMQMKKVIPALIRRFKMTLIDPKAELEADFSPAVVCLGPLMVKVEKAKRENARPS